MADRGTGEAVPGDVVITGEDWLDAICPFLRARDGSWRSASPAREHRCWAADPPSELPVLTQQRLCLVRVHDGCERFLHARELRSAGFTRDRQDPGGRDRQDAAVGSRQRERAMPQGKRGVWAGAGSVVARRRWFMSGVVVLAGAAVIGVIAFGGRGSGVPGESPGAPFAVPAPSVVGPDETPGPDGFRRYRVRAGDTLRTIADRFGITVRELRNANELGDPPRLEPGDLILVPVGG